MSDPIKHVVALMLENRSFDHMLGSLQAIYPWLDGVDPTAAPRSNPGPDGQPVEQKPNRSLVMDPDPIHEHKNAMHQIGTAANPMGSFVADFDDEYKAKAKSTRDKWEQVMGYYPLGDAGTPDSLPVVHALARKFAICDHWFSSMPGPTWQNRFFVHSATSLGHVLMPGGLSSIGDMRLYNQPTIYDRLHDKHVSWKIYHDGFALTLTMSSLWKYPFHYHDMGAFSKDVAGKEQDFPQYCFIEPRYTGNGENDQHPPSSVMPGETLIANVYNALRANEPLWNTTLLVILYDEHGGFYDHVYPPPTVAPDDHTSEWTFDQLGVRVPALLISPWVKAGVISTVFDHTSLLRYLCDKWGLAPLGRRMTTAAGQFQSETFAPDLQTLDHARPDTPERIEPPPLPRGLVPPHAPSHAEEAMLALARLLEVEMTRKSRAAHARALKRPPLDSAQDTDRIEAVFAEFLEFQKTQPGVRRPLGKPVARPRKPRGAASGRAPKGKSAQRRGRR